MCAQDTHTGNRPLYGNIPGPGDQLVSRCSLRPATGRAPQSDDSYVLRILFLRRRYRPLIFYYPIPYQ